MSALDTFNRIFEVGQSRRRRKWWRGYPPSFHKSGDADRDRPFDEANGGDGSDGNGAAPLFSPGPKHISELANLIAEASGGQVPRQQALDYLLYSAGGRKMAVRTRHAKRAAQKETNMQSDSEMMSAVVKRYGITAFCKSVEKGDVQVSEHELTRLIGEDAQRRGLTFSKLFAAQTPEGVTLRKAINATKEAQWVKQGIGPLMPLLPTWSHPKDANDPRDALAQLQDMAYKMRATADGSTLSAAQAFSRVYSDPANKDLVAAERAQARAKLPTVGGRAVGE
jgi:hypothetical protein